jgi:hypothetical protein
VRAWTRARAERLLDRLEAGLAGDLPLFAGTTASPAGAEVRVERTTRATRDLLVRLVAAAARRRGVAAVERRGDGVRALGARGGPALLAVRQEGGGWRVLVAFGGPVARAIVAGIPAPAEDGIGRAA